MTGLSLLGRPESGFATRDWLPTVPAERLFWALHHRADPGDLNAHAPASGRGRRAIEFERRRIAQEAPPPRRPWAPGRPAPPRARPQRGPDGEAGGHGSGLSQTGRN